jgi:hypothetical protein
LVVDQQQGDELAQGATLVAFPGAASRLQSHVGGNRGASVQARRERRVGGIGLEALENKKATIFSIDASLSLGV